MTQKKQLPPEEEMKKRTRRSFLGGGIAAAAALSGFAWLKTRPEEDGVAWPLRRVLRANESVARAYFSSSHRAAEFAPERAGMPKVNGTEGLEDPDFEPDDWRLRVEPAGLSLSLDDIRRLPRTEMVTELRCIEGWSQVVKWAGVRFADFAAAHRLDASAKYVALATPDNGYYVGLDRDSAMHPQTLLCYEMNGAPLEDGHGAPLRLVAPVKYGIKNIKRIGIIRWQDARPADYWAERGYDWYAGL